MSETEAAVWVVMHVAWVLGRDLPFWMVRGNVAKVIHKLCNVKKKRILESSFFKQRKAQVYQALLHSFLLLYTYSYKYGLWVSSAHAAKLLFHNIHSIPREIKSMNSSMSYSRPNTSTRDSSHHALTFRKAIQLPLVTTQCKGNQGTLSPKELC